MSRIMVIGDYFHGLRDLHQKLEDHHDVYPIAFHDMKNNQEPDLASIWHRIDFRDFHELTIRTMEFEPEVIVFLSYMLRPSRCVKFVDLADMAMVEILEHLRTTTGIHNTHLITIHHLIPNKHLTPWQLLEDFQKQALDIVSGMQRFTVLKVPLIIDNSPFGVKAWLKEENFEGSIQGILPEDLASEIDRIISDNFTGETIIEGYTIEIGLDEEIPEFLGDPEDFQGLSIN